MGFIRSVRNDQALEILESIFDANSNSEGDEAAKFYHRNLVMYSNFNQVQLEEDDRVFILMGTTHTAFFDMWLKRSPKYEVNNHSYLK